MTHPPRHIKWLAWLFAAGLFLTVFLSLYVWRTAAVPFRRTDLRVTGDWPLAGDDLLGYAGAAHGQTTMKKLKLGLSYEVYTDGAGVRVNAPGEEKPLDAPLLVVGGSCAYGYGLANTDTFSEELGRRLNISVANLAQVGYGTVQSLLSLERWLDRGGSPRVVVYPIIEDHLRRNLCPCAPSAAPYCLPAPYLDTHGETPRIVPPNMDHFTPEANWAFYRQILTTDGPGIYDVLWRLRIDLFRLRTSEEINPPQTDADREQALTYLLDRMASLCAAHDARLIVLYLPYFARSEPNPPSPHLLAALNEKLTFIDPTDTVAALPDPTVLGFPGDGHPNREGHQWMADILAPELQDLAQPAP